jgi:predicted dienelactone hydrolase
MLRLRSHTNRRPEADAPAVRLIDSGWVTEPIAGLTMSLPEIIVVLGAVGLVVARWLPPGARRPATIAAAVVSVFSATVSVIVGLRWQLVPVLAGAAVMLSLAVPALLRRRTSRPAWWPALLRRRTSRPAWWPALLRRRTSRPAWRAKWWLALPGTVACLALIAAGPVATWALPRPVFPAPSGQFAVGTTVLQWTDPDRPEPATSEPDDRRTVVVQLWYPAQRSGAGTDRAHYFGRTDREAHIVSGALAGYLGMPGLLLDDAAAARTRSVPDAAVADAGARFPVVLFSPGLGGVRTQNTAWAEQLASLGYVVAAIDHPYDSAAVVLADGRTIRTRVAATGDDAEDERRAAGWTAIRAADLSFVLTQLGRLDRGEIAGPLTGRLDTARAAATGHSLGGAAALQAAREDSRFAAVIDLDGAPHDPDPQPFHQPVLALSHPVDPAANPTYIPRLTQVLDLSTATSYRLTVPGSAHLSFTDAPLYLPPVPALVGSLGRTGGLHLTAATTAAFLDTTLRGEPGDLAAQLSTYGDLAVHR